MKEITDKNDSRGEEQKGDEGTEMLTGILRWKEWLWVRVNVGEVKQSKKII